MTAFPAPRVLADEPAPGVVRFIIDRPDKRNAIDFDVREQLWAALAAVAAAPGRYRAIVIGGSGEHFSAGGDLPSMVGLAAVDARARMRHIARLCRQVHEIELPVVTAMQGFSAGACVGLALLGDHVVVGPSTRILLPFMRLGLVPDWGLLYTLPLRVGLSAARRLLTSREPLSGTRALEIGLADELADDAKIMTTAVERATLLAALPTAAFARMKRRLNGPSRSLEEELEREENDQSELLLGEDFREGHAAFIEKREPDFVRDQARRGEVPRGDAPRGEVPRGEAPRR
jgi:2-(1,2-epoxy-1,2-dihydrophenyl)acetyl-CoA isomerase